MMRKILMCVLPTALAACAGAPQVTPEPPGVASAARAERPDVKVGDEWKFACGWHNERLWVVTSVDQTGIKATENGKPLLLTPDLNVLESPRRKDTDNQWLSFPLEVGKQWTADNNWQMCEFSGPEKVQVKVVDYEKVTVPAGQFDAFRLEITTSWTNETVRDSGANSGTYWYAPAARAIVKFNYKSSGCNSVCCASDACELVQSRLQP